MSDDNLYCAVLAFGLYSSIRTVDTLTVLWILEFHLYNNSLAPLLAFFQSAFDGSECAVCNVQDI